MDDNAMVRDVLGWAGMLALIWFGWVYAGPLIVAMGGG